MNMISAVSNNLIQMYPKLFSNTKNLPQTDAKPQKQQKPQQSHHHSQQQNSQDRPFSEPYNPQDDFDFTTLKFPQKYHFSLNPATIFPKDIPFQFQEALQNQRQGAHAFDLKAMGALELPQVKAVNWQQMEIVERCDEQGNDQPFF